MRLRATWVVVAFCVACCVPAMINPTSWLATTLVDLSGVVIATAVWSGSRRRDRSAAPAWRCLCAATTCLVVTHIGLTWWSRLGHPPRVTVFHFVALAGYAVMAYGFVRMVRLRAPGRFREGWLDGLALAVAATVAGWEFVIVPSSRGVGPSLTLFVHTAF